MVRQKKSKKLPSPPIQKSEKKTIKAESQNDLNLPRGEKFVLEYLRRESTKDREHVVFMADYSCRTTKEEVVCWFERLEKMYYNLRCMEKEKKVKSPLLDEVMLGLCELLGISSKEDAIKLMSKFEEGEPPNENSKSKSKVTRKRRKVVT